MIFLKNMLVKGVDAFMVSKINHLSFHVLRRTAALCLLVLMLSVQMMACASCGESKSDDSTMTESLLHSYLGSLCDYDIAGMNNCCMAKLDPSGDCEEAVRACSSLAGRIEWKVESISIHGNSAIAQVNLTLPVDFGAICELALSDLMASVDEGTEGDPAQLLASAIKKRAAKAKKDVLSAEISMAKVNNRWYIVQSLGVNRILSDIRTQVAVAYSMIGK